jgi:hypothetical protein
MSVAHRVGVIVAAAAFVCSKSYAPIYGTYPGLRSLIKEAEVIAAITILEKLSEDDFGGSARYKIRFDRTLKGNAPKKKQLVVYLRYLDITPEAELLRSPSPESPPTTHYFAPTERIEPFRAQSRWVAFLTKARQGVDAVYENVNSEGSSFPISPLRDLDALKVESLADTLILLFREYVEFKRTELKETEQQFNEFIHRRDE